MKVLDKTVNKNSLNNFRISKRNAYHQAGQAIGIYKWNKQKKLPPVHFQIVITRKDKSNAALDQSKDSDQKYEAFIEGGWLALGPAGRGREPGQGRLLSDEREQRIQRAIIGKRPEQLRLDFYLLEPFSGGATDRTSIRPPTLSERTVGKYLKRWGFTPHLCPRG